MFVPQFNDTIIIALVVISTLIMLVAMVAKARGKL